MGCGPRTSSRIASIARSWSPVRSTSRPSRRPSAAASAASDLGVARRRGRRSRPRRRRPARDAARPSRPGARAARRRRADEARRRAARSRRGKWTWTSASSIPTRPRPRADRGREVLRVRWQAIEGRADRGAQRPDRQPGRQRVDRHDAADVDEVAVGRLEGGVVEEHRRAALLELAREEQLVALVEATLHVLPAVPLGLRRAGLVGEVRGDDPDAPPGRPAGPDTHDAGARAHDRARRDESEGVQLVEDPQVVVSARQPEEQVADRAQADPGAHAPEHAGARQPARRQRHVERIGRRGVDAGCGRAVPTPCPTPR